MRVVRSSETHQPHRSQAAQRQAAHRVTAPGRASLVVALVLLTGCSAADEANGAAPTIVTDAAPDHGAPDGRAVSDSAPPAVLSEASDRPTSDGGAAGTPTADSSSPAPTEAGLGTPPSDGGEARRDAADTAASTTDPRPTGADAADLADASISDSSVADVRAPDPSAGDAASGDGAPPANSDGQALAYRPWPGGDEVSTVDLEGAYAGNLSGLSYDPGEPAPAYAAPTLWAVQNDPSNLYPLGFDGTNWVAPESWRAGKALRYPDGRGAPDAEGLTLAERGSAALYVAAERDNQVSQVSRLSVLRFDVSSPGSVLIATHEWDLTADLPAVPPNEGLEAITWVPDSALLALGFVDQSTAAPYLPARYPDHGSGVFFVGVEATGMIYGYALDHKSSAPHRLTAVASGQPAVMDLTFDRDVNQLWAYCDDTCGNRATVLGIATVSDVARAGGLVVRAAYERPSGLGNFNNEGIALAPESTCTGGRKSFFWADDGASAGHSLRRGSVACGALP